MRIEICPLELNLFFCVCWIEKYQIINLGKMPDF